MNIRSFLAIFTLLLISHGLTAQGVDDRAKDKATDKSNQRIDTRVDQSIDKGLDAIEGLFKKKDKKKKTTEGTQVDMPDSEDISVGEDAQVKSNNERANPLAGMFKKAVWNDKYTFDIVSNVTVTETKKNGKQESTDFVWRIGDNVFAMDFKDEKEHRGCIIMDAENQSFITLIEDEKEGPTGMAIAMNSDQLALAVDEGAEEGGHLDGSFTKTGRSKKIAGYTCYEYTYSDEESEGVMWMTEEVDVNMHQMAGLMTSGKSKHSELPAEYPSGYAMEMTSTDKKKKDSFHYLVTELRVDANEVIDTTTYNVQDPMSMMHGGQ